MRCARKWQARHSDKISLHLESCLVLSLEPGCAHARTNTHTHTHTHSHTHTHTHTHKQTHTHTHKHQRQRRECNCKWNWEVMGRLVRGGAEKEVSLQGETREMKCSSHTQPSVPNQYQKTEIQLPLSIYLHCLPSTQLFLPYILVYPILSTPFDCFSLKDSYLQLLSSQFPPLSLFNHYFPPTILCHLPRSLLFLSPGMKLNQ